MKGGREPFVCSACGKTFFYWVPEGNAWPKVKCYYCNAELSPRGEAPPAPAPQAPAQTEAPAQTDAPAPAGAAQTGQ